MYINPYLPSNSHYIFPQNLPQKIKGAVYITNEMFTLCRLQVSDAVFCYPRVERGHSLCSPLDGDYITGNANVTNPDLTPRIASVHKFQFAVVVPVECWIETVCYYVNGEQTLFWEWGQDLLHWRFH